VCVPVGIGLVIRQGERMPSITLSPVACLAFYLGMVDLTLKE